MFRRVLRIGLLLGVQEVVQALTLRGRIRRNKVSVGEPAEGSLTPIIQLAPLRRRYVIHISQTNKQKKIFNGGYLGSHNEEERSELR